MAALFRTTTHGKELTRNSEARSRWIDWPLTVERVSDVEPSYGVTTGLEWVATSLRDTLKWSVRMDCIDRLWSFASETMHKAKNNDACTSSHSIIGQQASQRKSPITEAQTLIHSAPRVEVRTLQAFSKNVTGDRH